MSALENDLPDVHCTDDYHATIGVEQAAIVPASRNRANAETDSARGLRMRRSPLMRREPLNFRLQDGPPVTQVSNESQRGTGDGWSILGIWAEMYWDFQKVRIANDNRIRQGNTDGEVLAAALGSARQLEEDYRKALAKAYRLYVPVEIREWQKAAAGIGEPLMARLLGHLGHPAIAYPKHWEATPKGEHKRVLVADEPYLRSLRQLWAYCGHGDPARKARRGMDATDALALGSPACKMLVHLIADRAIGKGGEIMISGKIVYRKPGFYRPVYDEARLEYEDRVHAEACVRCGPSGKPAPEGSPWSGAHQHAAALRKVGKEILRDLWKVSRQAAVA